MIYHCTGILNIMCSTFYCTRISIKLIKYIWEGWFLSSRPTVLCWYWGWFWSKRIFKVIWQTNFSLILFISSAFGEDVFSYQGNAAVGAYKRFFFFHNMLEWHNFYIHRNSNMRTYEYLTLGVIIAFNQM